MRTGNFSAFLPLCPQYVGQSCCIVGCSVITFEKGWDESWYFFDFEVQGRHHLGICSNADSSLRGLGWDPRFCISNKFSVSGSESSLGLKYLVVWQLPGNILDIQSHLYWFYFNYSLARNNGSFPEPALLGEERCLGSFQRLQNNEKMLTKEATAFKGAKFCWE